MNDNGIFAGNLMLNHNDFVLSCFLFLSSSVILLLGPYLYMQFDSHYGRPWADASIAVWDDISVLGPCLHC